MDGSQPGSDPRRFFSRDPRPASLPVGDVSRVFRAPPLGVGDRCEHRLGSPMLVVVDIHDHDEVTVAWLSGSGIPCEAELPRSHLRRMP